MRRKRAQLAGWRSVRHARASPRGLKRAQLAQLPGRFASFGASPVFVGRVRVRVPFDYYRPR